MTVGGTSSTISMLRAEPRGVGGLPLLLALLGVGGVGSRVTLWSGKVGICERRIDPAVVGLSLMPPFFSTLLLRSLGLSCVILLRDDKMEFDGQWPNI